MPLLSPIAKRARWLQLGTDEWYLDEIKNDYADPDEKGYEREDVGDYIRKTLRGYAEADFEFLGLHLPGAPDEVQPGTEVEEEYILTRLLYKPDWLVLNPRVAKYSTFKLYHWLKNCQHWDTKIQLSGTCTFQKTRDRSIPNRRSSGSFELPNRSRRRSIVHLLGY